jgi:hypothetical protein
MTDSQDGERKEEHKAQLSEFGHADDLGKQKGGDVGVWTIQSVVAVVIGMDRVAARSIYSFCEELQMDG